MYDHDGLGAVDLTAVRRAFGLPAITPRTVATAATELIGGPIARAAGDALRAGGGAREASVAVLRTSPIGQDIEAEWRRQRAAELVETLKRAAPWIIGGYVVLRALR